MMVDNKYARAYKEILEIIKYFPEEEYNKIPKEKINFFEDNMDNNYEFSINPEIDLSEQKISDEANSIFINIFLDYFATEEQKVKINEILDLNRKKKEIENNKKYNPDELFKKKQSLDYSSKISTQETSLVEYKDNFFIKFKNFILKLLHIK